MSRLLLVASCLALPLLATACDPAPAPPVISLEGPGLDDGELWLLPGAGGLVTIYSDDPDRASWTYAASGELALADDGGAGELASSVTVRAAAVGDGALTIRDADGVDLLEVPAHVRMPDRLLLSADRGRRQLGASVVVLTGDAGTIDVRYGVGDHQLDGAGLVDADSGVRSSRGVDHDAVEVDGRIAPYEVRLTGGPSAARPLQVLGIPAANTVLTLTTGEATSQAGWTASVEPSLRDRAGNPVAFGSATWTRDGVVVPAVVNYTYDPAAPPATVTVTVGNPGNTVTATTTIHARR